jgi:hypothetical protein
VNSWRNPFAFQIVPEQSKRAKDAQFHSRDRNTKRLGYFFVRPFLDNGENGRDA